MMSVLTVLFPLATSIAAFWWFSPIWMRFPWITPFAVGLA
jgi:hypothetical protein